MIMELPDEVIEDLVSSNVLVQGVPRQGKERIDGYSERPYGRFAVIRRPSNRCVKDAFSSADPSRGARSSDRVGFVEDVFGFPSKRGCEPTARESWVGVGVEGKMVDGPKVTMVKGTICLLN